MSKFDASGFLDKINEAAGIKESLDQTIQAAVAASLPDDLLSRSGRVGGLAAQRNG